MRSRQAGLRPASVEATAFLSDLGRYRYGVKMEGQEENRQQHSRANKAP